MVTDILVILSATWLAVPKYNGTKANHITQVVYIVNPVTTNTKLTLGFRNVSMGLELMWIICDYCSTDHLLSRLYLNATLTFAIERATLSNCSKLACFQGYVKVGYLKSVHVYSRMSHRFCRMLLWKLERTILWFVSGFFCTKSSFYKHISSFVFCKIHAQFTATESKQAHKNRTKIALLMLQ